MTDEGKKLLHKQIAAMSSVLAEACMHAWQAEDMTLDLYDLTVALALTMRGLAAVRQQAEDLSAADADAQLRSAFEFAMRQQVGAMRFDSEADMRAWLAEQEQAADEGGTVH
jgi:hypothetical protein